MANSNNAVRINKYLADKGLATRRGADVLVEAGKVFVNGTKAVLGQKVGTGDRVEVRGGERKSHRYLAYHKPAGYVTVNPVEGEKEIADIFKMEGLFPIGRLDKNSEGLLILTNDGRVTDRLLNPKYDHEKEYAVEVSTAVGESFRKKLESGVNISSNSPFHKGSTRRGRDLNPPSSSTRTPPLEKEESEITLTRPCKVDLIDPHHFRLALTEGKKHQIKRMTEALGVSVVSLKRLRIMNIKLGNQKPNTSREIKGKELETFLKKLGLC